MPQMSIPATQKERDRFYSKIKPMFINGQWHQIFQGYCRQSGHGRMLFRGKVRSAHCLSWFFTYGYWPEPCCLHKNICHIPRCIEPDHLYEGTRKDNTNDMLELGNHPSQLVSQSQEIRNKIALAHLGQIATEEARKKMSLAHIGIHRGEKSPMSKLSDVQRDYIVNVYQNTGRSQQSLANELGVSQRLISLIVRTWRKT